MSDTPLDATTLDATRTAVRLIGAIGSGNRRNAERILAQATDKDQLIRVLVSHTVAAMRRSGTPIAAFVETSLADLFQQEARHG